jgi:hypothetical protein
VLNSVGDRKQRCQRIIRNVEGRSSSEEAFVAESRSRPVVLDLYLPSTPFLSAPQTARLLGFSSGEALHKARQTGRLPFPMFQLTGRRGWFAATHVVKEWIESTLVSQEPTNVPEEEPKL